MKPIRLLPISLHLHYFPVYSTFQRRIFSPGKLNGLSLLFVLLFAQIVTAQSPMGSEWTYQGVLNVAGNPLNGTADFEFSLHDADSLGNQVGSALTVSDVQLVNGRFTVQLDFGVNVFQGDARWLNVRVRSPHDPTNAGPFTPLAPRQSLTAAPYSLQTRGIFVDDLGRAGLGTTSLANSALTIQGTNPGNGVAQWLHLQDVDGNDNWHLNNLSGGFNFAETGISDFRLFLAPGGNIGIGTSNPSNRLTVNGAANFNGNVGIGNFSPHNPLTVAGNASITGSLGVGVNVPAAKLDVVGTMRLSPTPSDPFGGELIIFGQNGSLNLTIQTGSGAPHHSRGQLLLHDEFSTTRAGIRVNQNGQGEVFGDVKNFCADNPFDPSTQIWYASLEGPEAAAYVRGTALLANGEATVLLPEHFAAIAVSQGMTVQVTPRSADSLGLAVIERAVDRIVVRELQSGNGSYEFDWHVEAARKGFEDYEVIRPKMDYSVADELNR